MKEPPWVRSGVLMLVGVASIALGVACTQQVAMGGPRAWIDAPRDGWVVLQGAPVEVVSHAYADEGVTEGLLLVNDVPYARAAPRQAGSFVEFTHQWFPQQAGEYVLYTRAYRSDGSFAQSDPVRVRVRGKQTVTPVSPVTPTTVRAPDLEIVRVEAVVAGDKNGVPFCNTRVTYRNAGETAVPDSFVIQFDYDGTPTFANSVAGGLAPGATTEITFVYQFIGSPNIGINLDSTGVIVEQNELNNTFTGALPCGAMPRESGPSPTPVPSATPTVTPTAPPTSTVTNTPTRLPTITATPTPTPVPTHTSTPPPPTVSFRADRTELERGGCTLLRWDVENATAVYLDGHGVEGHGIRNVCIDGTVTFQLIVESPYGAVEKSVTITLIETVDTTPPPVPEPQVPADSLAIDCKQNQTLAWLPVNDDSGIRGYYVKLERQVTANNWQSVRGWGPLTDKQVTADVQCGVKYRWAVRAEDNAGNLSDWSDWSRFAINLP